MDREASPHILPIIDDYLDVFPKELPGLPPRQEVECSINLVLGAQPINIPSNQMSRIEHQEQHH